jgi:hypothetical protein
VHPLHELTRSHERKVDFRVDSAIEVVREHVQSDVAMISAIPPSLKPAADARHVVGHRTRRSTIARAN